MSPMTKWRRMRLFGPILVLCFLAYLDYTSCYIAAYDVIYLHHSRVSAIWLWVLLGLFQAIALAYWVLIFVSGSGSVPKFANLDLYNTGDSALLPLPEAFVCDEQGYPFWCSKCQNLKPDRSLHLHHMSHCVPRFDHYCFWVGTAIGRDNYFPFIKFLQSLCLFTVVLLVYLSVYARHIYHSHKAHLIVSFILGCAIFAFNFIMFCSVLYHLNYNTTSLDGITRRTARLYKRWQLREKDESAYFQPCIQRVPRVETGERFMSIATGDTRAVVPYRVEDSPYNCGFKANFVSLTLKGNHSSAMTLEVSSSQLWKASLVFVLPFFEFFASKEHQNDPAEHPLIKHSDMISPDFLQKMKNKVKHGYYKQPSYISDAGAEKLDEAR